MHLITADLTSVALVDKATAVTILENIGVASYGALGYVPPRPLDFQLFNFSGHFRAEQTLIFDSMWLSKNYSLKEPSHHDVLASARLAFSDFLGNVGKRP